jgi:hypothetical protein
VSLIFQVLSFARDPNTSAMLQKPLHDHRPSKNLTSNCL